MNGDLLDKQGVPKWACDVVEPMSLLDQAELLECAEYLRFEQLADFMAACIANYRHALHPVVAKATFALSRNFTKEEEEEAVNPAPKDAGVAAGGAAAASSASASAAAV